MVFGGHDSSDTFELQINEDGQLTSVELVDCSLDHPGHNAYKLVGHAIFAVNGSGRLMKYVGENWLKIQ